MVTAEGLNAKPLIDTFTVLADRVVVGASVVVVVEVAGASVVGGISWIVATGTVVEVLVDVAGAIVVVVSIVVASRVEDVVVPPG
jgi:hypothetical protein